MPGPVLFACRVEVVWRKGLVQFFCGSNENLSDKSQHSVGWAGWTVRVLESVTMEHQEGLFRVLRGTEVPRDETRSPQRPVPHCFILQGMSGRPRASGLHSVLKEVLKTDYHKVMAIEPCVSLAYRVGRVGGKCIFNNEI